MEINIKASSKEIADLVSQLQSQPGIKKGSPISTIEEVIHMCLDSTSCDTAAK